MTSAQRPSSTVADAVVAVIAEHGLEGTSVRRVAARAGVSIGTVQHYFPSKDAMLAAAMGRVEETFRRRLADEAAQLADRPDMVLRATLRSLVPRSPAERADTALWLAFVARAVVHDATAAQHRSTWQRAEDGLARLITACVPSSPDPTREPAPWVRDAAAELLALADGLAISSAIEPGRMPPERARQLLDAAADRVLHQAAGTATPDRA